MLPLRTAGRRRGNAPAPGQGDEPMTKNNATEAEPLRVVGYIRVSTEEQKRSGAGLAA